MKNVLKFSGLIALVLGAVGFILMMATPAVVYNNSLTGTTTNYAGTLAIFGGETTLVTYTLAWNALLAWIFSLVAIIIVCCGIVLPLLKIKALDKFSGILNLVAVALFAVAGVFLFFTVPAFHAANEIAVPEKSVLGAGYVFAAIFYLVSAGFAALPVVAQIIKK